MGKHETILKNLFAITRSTSQATAMKGWEIDGRIDLPERAEAAACELCGTRFRKGATVSRQVPQVRKLVTMTVGGDCLITLLHQQFQEPGEVKKRRAITARQITERYEGLVDVGAWITWIYENAPPALVSAAVRLKHLGVVRTTAELKRLIAFHDRKRRYPAEAVLPVTSDLRACGVHVPASITLDQARRLVSSLPSMQLSSLLARKGEEYLSDWTLSQIGGWDEAWRKASALQRRLLAALAQLSERLQCDGIEIWKDWLTEHIRLPRLKCPSVGPQFAWNRACGLCLLVDDAPTSQSMAEVLLWGRNQYTRFQVSSLSAVVAKQESTVVSIEREAFWKLPAWCEP